jgi:DNA repair photolyase
LAVEYRRTRVKSALSRSGLPDLDYALNPYIGCAHGCLYCYARGYTRIAEVVERWGRLVYVKENLLDVLRQEVRKLKPGLVGVSTITDPYQPIENTEELTRRAIQVLLKGGFRVSIQTKSPLVVRDLDILLEYARSVDVGFTIITMDEGVSSILEPGAPPPRARAEALIKISRAGIRTWLFYGPVIPEVNDGVESFEEVLRSLHRDVDLVLIDKLRITPEVRRPLGQALANSERVLRLAVSRDWWARTVKSFERLCSELGVRCVPSIAEPERVVKSLADYSSGTNK